MTRNRAELDAAQVPMGERTREEQDDVLAVAFAKLRTEMQSPAFVAAVNAPLSEGRADA